MNKSAGFSLIELIITLLLIGILTSIAIPIYRSPIDHANEIQARTALFNLANDLETYFDQHGTYIGFQLSSGKKTQKYFSLELVTLEKYSFTISVNTTPLRVQYTLDQDGNLKTIINNN